MRNNKAIKYLGVTALLFALFYFNVHWLIKDDETRVRFYLISTAFEFLILGALWYQYSKLTRCRICQATACLFMIYALGNYIDEIWGKATTIGANEIAWGIIGLIVVIARFYKEWHKFLINKVLPIIFLGVISYLIYPSRIFTAIIIISSSLIYAIWILTQTKQSKK